MAHGSHPPPPPQDLRLPLGAFPVCSGGMQEPCPLLCPSLLPSFLLVLQWGVAHWIGVGGWGGLPVRQLPSPACA